MFISNYLDFLNQNVIIEGLTQNGWQRLPYVKIYVFYVLCGSFAIHIGLTKRH
jgi:hypothetical protein